MTATDPIIRVENLSKRYLVGHEAARRGGYSSLRETLTREVRKLVSLKQPHSLAGEIHEGHQ